MLSKILRLTVVAITTIVLLKISTFGWRFSKNPRIEPNQDKNLLAEQLKKHVYVLSHEIGNRDVYYYDNLKKAADYISAQFKAYGYKVEFQEYSIENKKYKNIIAEKKGLSSAGEIIVVGAHYDTCFNPGADDNASGVAGLLELAKVFSRKETRRTIRFLAFVNEEPPFFQTKDMGSFVYTRNAKKKAEDIKGAVILEMIGYYSNKKWSQRAPYFLGFFYPNKGNFVIAIGNSKSGWMVKKIFASFKERAKLPVESFALDFVKTTAFSDHWSFWKEGYCAVMVTDTAFYRNPHYHRSSDTYEKLNYTYMAEVVNGLEGFLLKFAEQ